MNSITAFDIRLNKDVYYLGESVLGNVILGNSQNIQVEDILVILRGKAHIRIKSNRASEGRVIQDNQYILNEKLSVWDLEEKCSEEDESVLSDGLHHFPFQFRLPNCPMPCSLETKFGTIRFYIKVIIKVPRGSMPQGIKYFTIIGPSIDCMNEKYCCALLGQNKKVTWQRWCRRGALALRVIMDRTAYLCGENVRILVHVENRQDTMVRTVMRLIQHVEYFFEKIGGEKKHIDCVVLESKIATLVGFNITRTLPVQPHTQGKFDTAQSQSFVLPVVPPTLVGLCRLLQIFYVFEAYLEDEKGNKALQMAFPLTIATLPFRKATMSTTTVDYDVCCPHVEGGRYISPDFRVGFIHDEQKIESSEQPLHENAVLYRPLYVCIAQQKPGSNCCDIDAPQIKKSASIISGSGSRLIIPEREQNMETESTFDDYISSFDKTDYQEFSLSFDCSSSFPY